MNLDELGVVLGGNLANGRNSKGHFVKGHRISVGNHGGRAPRSKEEKYLKAFTRGVSLKDWEAAVRAILKKAMDGDVAAWKALAPYALGPPAQSYEATEIVLTIEEWRETAQERLSQVEEL